MTAPRLHPGGIADTISMLTSVAGPGSGGTGRGKRIAGHASRYPRPQARSLGPDR